MELDASCSVLAAPLLDGPVRQLPVLGAGPAALYLDAGASVVAVLSDHAVQLPRSVRVATASLTGLRPDASVRVGDGALSWLSGGRAVRVRVVRRWLPGRVPSVAPRGERVRELTAAVAVPAVEVAELLGRGPGLTPSGDDVLAGHLLGCRAFGIAGEPLRRSVLALATTRTTALSADLLRLAAEGWCIPQAAAIIAALGRERPDPTALQALIGVGSSSGSALAAGIAAAAAQVVLGAAA